MLNEQIKTITYQIKSHSVWLIFPAFAFCFTVYLCFLDLRLLWLLLFIVAVGWIFSFPAAKGMKIRRQLRCCYGKALEKREITCSSIKFIYAHPQSRYSSRICGVRIFDSDGNEYIYVFTDWVEEMAWPRDMDFSRKYSKKINSKLSGKTLHVKLYGGSSIIADIKEFPLYEVINWKKNGNTNGKYYQGF